MKNLFAALVLSAFASTALADDIVPARSAQKVRVDAVHVTIEGENGWPMQRVKVTATFGNSCSVPMPEELVKLIDYTDSDNTLRFVLGVVMERVCTAEYDPKTVTIDLGSYVRPADGLFDQIEVNGVLAPL